MPIVDDVGPSDLPDPDYAYGYRYVARAALSNLLHLTNGQTAWDWLDSHIHTQSCLNDDPTWAFVPWVAYPDVTAPSAVTSLAASSFTNTTCVLTWNAPGDDGSSGRASHVRHPLFHQHHHQCQLGQCHPGQRRARARGRRYEPEHDRHRLPSATT